MRGVLRCVTRVPLLLRERSRLTTDRPYALSLGDLRPVPLRATPPLWLSVGQFVKVVATAPDDPAGRFVVKPVRYLYQLSLADGDEVLTFHWTPEATGEDDVAFPHLHIGPAISGGRAAIRPKDLHKAHIPTGIVTIAAVVRLAIAEFGVGPLRADWLRLLDAGEAADDG